MKASQIKREIEDSDEFAKLLEDSFSKAGSLEPGDRIRGTVASVRGDAALVDISGKSEAYLSASEIMENGKEMIKTGDTLEFYVVAQTPTGIQLTNRIGRGYLSDSIIRIAQQHAVPVRGTVKEVINGGYSVIVGDFRGFCPFSQMDGKKGNESDYLNRSFDFLVSEFRSSNLVLSRRSLIEKASQESYERISKDIIPGALFDATVTRTADFGVFADIGGVEILVPKSELSFSRLVNTSAFKSGQNVRIKIIAADIAAKRISGSIKQAAPDPWLSISSFKEGEQYSGTITNIIKSGAFVELAEGIEGMIHISKLSPVRKFNRVEDAVSIGDKVSVTVERIDHKEKRISLVLETGEKDPWKESGGIEGRIEEATIESVNSAGLGIRLENGMEGFVPKGQLLKKGDIFKEYKAGEKVRIFLLETDSIRRRVLGSEKEIEAIEERKNMESYMKNSGTSSTSSLGALLGDKLKGFK